MPDDIVYKGLTGLDAIAVWHKSHPESTEFLRAIFAAPPSAPAPIAVDRDPMPQTFCIEPQDCDLQTTPAEAAKRFLATRPGQFISEVIKQTTIGTFKKVLDELRPKLATPDLLEGLDPEGCSKDAGIYMATLVCHIWITQSGYSAQKALNYVFRTSKEGSPLYSDCRYARILRQKYGRSESTIWKDAKMLHSKYSSWKKKSRQPYMPNIWRDMVQKSKVQKERETRTNNKRGH